MEFLIIMILQGINFTFFLVIYFYMKGKENRMKIDSSYMKSSQDMTKATINKLFDHASLIKNSNDEIKELNNSIFELLKKINGYVKSFDKELESNRYVFTDIRTQIKELQIRIEKLENEKI